MTTPIERIQWTCPVCKRRYAIPATAPTPSRCPQCRQAEEEAAARAVPAPVILDVVRESTERANEQVASGSPLSALAAIQLEVAEEATRGPTTTIIPAVRHGHGATSFKMLEHIATAYTVLAGLSIVGGFAGLLFGLRAAFVMEATVLRTYAIFYALGEFAAGLIAALGFFAFREVIHLLLAIEENTRAQ